MDTSGLPDYGDRKNRCATCGFFALRVPGTTRTEEANALARDGTISWPNARPDCFIYAANLYAEVAASRTKEQLRATPANELHEQIKAVVEKERDGAHWFPWRPHFTPTWHLERRDMLQLEQSRRDHDLRLREMEIDVHRSTAKIQADSLEISRTTKETMQGLRDIAARAEASDATTDHWMRNWTRAAVVVGGVALVGFLLQFLFPGFGPWAGDNLIRGVGVVWDWLVGLWPR